jgi:proteic killer suppression protein
VAIKEVQISNAAQKDLRRAPLHIIRKLDGWIRAVELSGLETVRRIPGYHDEPLKAQRAGQRSIRLSKSYRAIYVFDKDNRAEFVRIEEVSKHGY